MRRPLLSLMLLLLAGPAHADWRALTVSGTPTDVEVWRPGVFSVSTTTQAVLVENGVVTQTVPGESIGTLLTPDNCLRSFVQSTGRLVASAACTRPDDLPFGATARNAVALARTEAGAAFAYGESGGALSLVFSPTATSGGAWVVPANPPTRPLRMADAVRQGGVDHALFGLVGGTGGELVWYAGPATSQQVLLGASATVLDLELFPADGPGPGALVSTQTGLYRGVLGTSATPFAPVPLPAGITGVSGAEVNPGAGTALGDGFGLAVGRTAAGTHAVLSALPGASPTEVARTWQLNSAFPGPGLPAGFPSTGLDRVRCVGASFCVLTVRSSTGPNVLLYGNAAPPALGALPALTLDEGTQLRVPLTATDADGDAVRLTAALAAGGSSAVSLAGEPDSAGLQLVLSAGPVCGPSSAELAVTASDGLASHDLLARLPVTVRNSQPDPPVVLGEVDSSGLEVRCGEGAHGRLVQPLPAGLCSDVAVGWTQLSGPPLEQPNLRGAEVEVRTVERGLDALLGETVVLQVRADAGSGNTDTREQSVVLGAEPFVSLSHRTERPLAVEGETVGVFAELSNPTACALQDVRVEEQLGGLDYVPGSARFDGEPVAAEVQEGRLVVTGLPLGAAAHGTLSYSVRTRVLGSAQLGGEAFRRAVRISTPAAEVPEPGSCGCGGAPAGASALSLLALGWLLRRRRGALRARS